MKRLAFVIIGFAFAASLSAQVVTKQMEEKAQAIVSQMTLDEKIQLINGHDNFYTHGIPRLNIPEIRMSDGPQGVRGVHSTMYPCNLMNSAGWNRATAYSYGQGMGIDSRERGVQIILGPAVNIYRYPLAGRSFEYMGEDPYLASEMAVQYIKGVQDEGVMACVKHFACNNQEWERNYVSSDVDERTLQEIYLPAFRKAVMEGNVGSVMNSYNLLNSVWATENSWLNWEVLRGQWGFKGILMSDWGAVHDAIAAILGGTDLDMPGGKIQAKPVKEAIEQGIISESCLDIMCQHIIQTIYAFGWDNLQVTVKENEEVTENKESAQRALESAREGITLLKNSKKGKTNVLPLKGKTMVVGCKADTIVMGGGSGEVHPYHNVTVWQGLQSLLGKNVVKGIDCELYKAVPGSCLKTPEGQSGYKLEYWNNRNRIGTPDKTLVVDKIDFSWAWGASPVEGVAAENFGTRTTTLLTLPKTTEMMLEVGGDDGYRLLVDDVEVAADYKDHSVTRRYYHFTANANQTYKIVIEHYNGAEEGALLFNALQYDEEAVNAPAYKKQYQGVSNIVVCLGFDLQTEFEGSDHDYSLSPLQKVTLQEAASHGKNVILVVNAGCNPNLAELEPLAEAIIMAYYPGQEGGTAIAEILTGKTNPSGKLPFTIEKRLEDNPAYGYYYDKEHTDHMRTRYAEGVFTGYRGYDKAGTDVLYPFGYGLSYSTFEYSNITTATEGQTVKVSFDVKNTSKVAGKEVCEVYVSDKECSVPRPLKELKGFEKVMLKAGETKRVTITLPHEAFAFWDVKSHSFVVEPGEFDILVGGSSRNLPLTATITK